jgi:GH18 family chitinase
MGSDNIERSRNLALFNSGLKAALPDGAQMTTAISLFMLNNGFFTEAMHKPMDLVNLMIYDATGPWESSTVGPHSDWDFFQNTIAMARSINMPDSKIIPGVPFYGVRFKSATSSVGAEHMTYGDIVSKYPGAEDKNEITDDLIYYDGKPMIRQKARYVMDNNLGGIMFWEITQDSKDPSKSLLNVIDDVIGTSK